MRKPLPSPFGGLALKSRNCHFSAPTAAPELDPRGRRGAFPVRGRLPMVAAVDARYGARPVLESGGEFANAGIDVHLRRS